MIITAMPLTEAIQPVREPHTTVYAAIAAMLLGVTVITYLIRIYRISRNPEIEQTRTVSATVLAISSIGASIMFILAAVSVLRPTVSMEQIEDSLADDLQQNYQITAAEYDLSGTRLFSFTVYQDWVEGFTENDPDNEARVRVITDQGHSYLYAVMLDEETQHAVLQPVSGSISSAPEPEQLQK